MRVANENQPLKLLSGTRLTFKNPDGNQAHHFTLTQGRRFSFGNGPTEIPPLCVSHFSAKWGGPPPALLAQNRSVFF